MSIITLLEHENLYKNEEYNELTDEQKEKTEERKIKSELFQKNEYLKEKDEMIPSAYYIGLDWLIDDELAFFVKPKIENIDFLKMFMECYKHKTMKPSNRIYKIFTNKKSISVPAPKFEITPFIIIHYMRVLDNFLKRGLKKDYVRIQENLNSKIKGKILFAQHLKKNEMMGRKDRVFCNYQEYSVDCIENQILKKAFLFAKQYLQKNQINFSDKKAFDSIISLANPSFENVSDIKQIRILKQFKINKINKLYKDYTEALKLAKLILQRFSYNIQEIERSESQKFYPFYIDMSLLFETYIGAKLKDKYGSNIIYHSHGKYGETDFLKTDEQLIIDTKYKKLYDMSYNIEDIRQLSGYARDTGILKKLKISEIDMKNTVAPCLIIYPNQSSENENFQDFLNLISDETPKISEFTKFYKIGIKLPTVEEEPQEKSQS